MEVLTTGSQVDQFRIVRRLGKGGMSEVYLARDTVLGRKVALKIIRAELAKSPRRLKLFLQEARLTAKFAHQHIITIYTVGEFEGHPYLALEYLEGQTLSQRMRAGPMSARETMRVGLAIAQALEEAHSHGVLHRDLKPANVVIPQDGRLRVLDFGISKIVEDDLHPPALENDFSIEVKPEETAIGEIKGTPTYMAPERWLGEKATGAADVWALGVILYKMLTQVHPFPGEDRRVEAIARRIVTAQKPPSLPLDLDVPSALTQLITSMLDRQASLRPTGQQIVEVLLGLLQRRPGQMLERRSPFRGLLPFSERHADLFFGRGAEIEMAIERLRNEPILPVVGPSGAGKSSFVAAGIVPRLRESDQWLVLTVRPGTCPFGALSSIIQAGWRGDVGNTTSPSSLAASILTGKNTNRKVTVGAVEHKPDEKKNVTQEEAATELTVKASEPLLQNKNNDTIGSLVSDTQSDREKSAEGLAQKLLENPATLLLELQALADETRGKVLLFVDQLEELYTQEHAPHLRRSYMEAISHAADDPEGPIRVIFTLREDYLTRVVEGTTARETLSHIMMLGPPGQKALYETVTKPVALAGYSYEDEGLPEEMLHAVRDAPASLPILQFACSQLWNLRDTENRILTRTAFEEMGGVEGALASKADELLAGLSEIQQKVLKQLMLRLVTPEGTRRVIAAQELLDNLDTSARIVLDRLTASRMVVSRRAVGQENAGTELELVHDSLIHSWKPLVRWLELSREEVVFLDEVSRASELWETRGRPREEVWSGRALDEALIKLERCEAVPGRVREFLQAGELRRQAHARGRRKVVFAVIGALLIVIAVLGYMNHQMEIQRDRQQQANASALREGARAAYTTGDFLEARSKLRGSLEARDSTQARALWWLLENEPLVWSKTLDSFGNSVSVSPDGRLIAVAGMSINIYDTKTLERRILSGHEREVASVDFSPNSRWLSSGAYDRKIRIWDLRADTVKVLKGHSSVIRSVVFSPDGKRLASGSLDTTIKIWDIESGTLIRTLENNSKIRKIRFSPDGRFIISVHYDGKVRLRNANTYELEQVLEEPGIQISDAVISADGKLLACGGSEGVLVVQDLAKRQEQARIIGNTSSIYSMSFSADGYFLAASTRDGNVLIWDTKSWSLRRQFRHAKIYVSSVSFLPEGTQLVSTSYDGTLKLWTMDARSFRNEGVGHGSPIYGLAFAPNGKTIVTASAVDGELRFWDVTSSQSIRRIEGHDTGIEDISFSHRGKLLAAGAFDGSIRLYTFPEGQLLKTLYGHRNVVTRVLFSSDERQLISSSYDKTIAYWDLESQTHQKSLPTSDRVNYMDIDPAGRLLASASLDKVQVRDIETGQVRQTFSGHTDVVLSVVFSPDGKSLYTSSRDHTVRRYLLDSASTDGEVVARHQGHIYWIDVTNSTNNILGTPSGDKTAKIWKIDSREVLTLKSHRGEVNTLRFSPDGNQVATVSDDGTLRLWDTITGRPLWRAPLMLEQPLLLATEKGWISFENNSAPSPSTKQWQKAVDARGKLASTTGDGQTLCLVSFGDELEIWDIPNDEVTFKTKKPGIQQILSIRTGCLTRSEESLTLTRANGEAVTLGKQAEAMSRSEDSVFVLQGGKVRILDLEGNPQDEFRAPAGATALTLVGDNVALGYSDGRIEVWSRVGSNLERVFICREAEGNPVITIISGPPGTIIAGFERGTVGIWSIETGERLFSHRLHGPVIHLLLRDEVLYAATELGSRVRFDLSMFYIDYCDLMERIWSSVFWIWEEGRARYREIPSDHECRKRR